MNSINNNSFAPTDILPIAGALATTLAGIWLIKQDNPDYLPYAILSGATMFAGGIITTGGSLLSYAISGKKNILSYVACGIIATAGGAVILSAAVRDIQQISIKFVRS